MARIIERRGRITAEHCPPKGDGARFSKNHPKATHDEIERKIDELAPRAAAAMVRALSADHKK